MKNDIFFISMPGFYICLWAWCENGQPAEAFYTLLAKASLLTLNELQTKKECVLWADF